MVVQEESYKDAFKLSWYGHQQRELEVSGGRALFTCFCALSKILKEQKLSNHKLKEEFKKVFLDWDRISLNGQAYNV